MSRIDHQPKIIVILPKNASLLRGDGLSKHILLGSVVEAELLLGI